MFEMNDIASNTKARSLSNYYINDPSNPLFVAINNFSSLLYFDDFLKSSYKKMFSKDENGEYSISFGLFSFSNNFDTTLSSSLKLYSLEPLADYKKQPVI